MTPWEFGVKNLSSLFFPRINKQGNYVSVRHTRIEHSALGSDLGYIRGLSQSGQDRQTASPHGHSTRDAWELPGVRTGECYNVLSTKLR